MKKLTLLLLLCVALNAKSQNLLGESLKYVKEFLDGRGYILDEGWNKKGVYYVTATDQTTIKAYFFTERNVCYAYTLIVDNGTYEQAKDALISEGYYQYDGYFYKGDYRAEIKYMNPNWAIKIYFYK